MIAITGSSGFIGQHLMSMLMRRNEIVAIDRKPPPPWIDHGPVTPLICCASSIGRELEHAPPSVVVHLAGSAGVDADRNETVANNIGVTNAVAEYCMQVGAHLIFASSGAAATVAHGPPRWWSPYGISKLASEYYLCDMATRGLDVAIVRFANVYGRQPHPKSIISRAVQCAIDGVPLTIHGDGLQERDFVHVGDLCLYLSRLIDARAVGYYDACSGDLVTVREVWSEAIKAAKQGRIRPVYVRDAACGADRPMGSPARPDGEFLTPLSRGMAEVAAWLQTAEGERSVFDEVPR